MEYEISHDLPRSVIPMIPFLTHKILKSKIFLLTNFLSQKTHFQVYRSLWERPKINFLIVYIY